MTVPRFGSCSRMPSPPFHSVAGVASRSLVGFFPSLPTKGLEPLRLSTCLLLLRWRLVSGQRTLEPFQTGWELSVSTEVNLNEPKARSRSKDHHGTARAHQSPPESRLFPLVSGQRVPAGMVMLPSRWHPAAAGLRSPPSEQIVRPMPAAPSGRFWCAKCASPNPDKPPHVVGAWWRRLWNLPRQCYSTTFPHTPPRCGELKRRTVVCDRACFVFLLTGLPNFLDSTPYR